MKTTKMLKLTGLIAMVFAIAIGCSSTETGQSEEQAAKDAIAAAKEANARAAAIGYEWRDTAEMIKKAEEALGESKYEDAIKLANKARKQAENAIAQKQAEDARIAHLFGKATAVSAGAGQYSVVKGDNLWNISAKPDIYNNPYQWPLIYKANTGKIKDADLIYPGQVFDINTNPTSAEADAAVRHAKTRGAWSLGAVEASDKAYLAQ
jgi:nucleoid-associated protein YgaU